MKTPMNSSKTWLVLFALLPLTAMAQTQRSGDNNARAMQQLQQLTVERTQLKAENDKFKQEVDELKKQLAAATAGQSALQQKLKATEASVARDSATSAQSAESLEKMRGQMQELVTRFRETATSLKEVETDRNTARAQLQTRERDLNTCVDRNVALYDLNSEVLDRLEHKGVWSSLTEKEPFTRIQRTRLENLIDEYRDRAAELHSVSAAKK
jgi:chromosome segregation ATPase